MEHVRNIDCSCGEWEQMPADESRYHSQHFTWHSNLDNGQALYQCPCGETVESTIEEAEHEH